MAGAIHVSAAQNFRDFIENSLVLVDSGPSPTHPLRFLPRDSLKTYLTPKRLRQLGINPSEWQIIHTGYTTIFTILFLIDKAIYITRFLPHHCFDDEHLPFQHFEGWPLDCQSFSRQFDNAQWQFCAQTLKKGRLNNTQFPPQAIVPFIRRKAIKEDVVSSTYMVELHPEYDRLIDKDENDNPSSNTYFLKTCGEKDAPYHYKEVEAYTILMGQEDVSRNMALFHGSWIQNQKYHMLLEYVHGGTLMDFFRLTEAPSTEEDKFKFWEKLLELMKPVLRIHQIPSLDKEHEYHQGVHHDIKPDNILVSQSTNSARYDVTFKLADLGLTDFVIKKRKDQDINNRDAHGTQMYSAPEYCRDDHFLEQSRLQAKPSKDIWALGCVFSEAAVWSNFGFHRLEEYRKRRAAETDIHPELVNSGYSGCFHDGKKVLSAVINMHLDVRRQRRDNDHIVGDMITIIEDMLEAVSSRPDGVELHRRFRKALNTAKSWSDDASFPGPFRTSTSQSVPRVPPPELPPGEEYKGMLGLGIARSPPQTPNGFGPISMMGGLGMAPNLPPWPRYQSDDRRSSVASTTGSSRQSGSLKRNVRYSGSSRHSVQSTHTIPKHLSFLIPQQTEEEDEITSAVDEDDSNRQYINPSHTSPSMPKRRSSLISQQCSSGSTQRLPTSSTLHQSSTNTRQDTRLAYHPADQEAKNQRSITPISLRKLSLRQNGGLMEVPPQDYPKASVPQILEWISEKKLNPNMPLLSGHAFLGSLHRRDQVFLVDDSDSMKPHWNKVKDTFNALAYLVKRADLDGIDLYFTNSGYEAHSKDRKGLMKVFNTVKPEGKCIMKLALGKILESYRPEPMMVQTRGLFSRKKKLKWGLSVYVLTDGVWNDGVDELCGVHEPIATLVKRLSKNGMMEHHVGIQFIRFGDDVTGKRRLNSLDNGLRRFKIKKDIVDTEPCDGNVWKMLVGPIDPVLDNDPPKSGSTTSFVMMSASQPLQAN